MQHFETVSRIEPCKTQFFSNDLAPMGLEGDGTTIVRPSKIDDRTIPSSGLSLEQLAGFARIVIEQGNVAPLGEGDPFVRPVTIARPIRQPR